MSTAVEVPETYRKEAKESQKKRMRVGSKYIRVYSTGMSPEVRD